MQKITKVTRKGILLDLLKEDIGIEKIILNFFDSDNLPSYDGRFANMSGDYFQHRENNLDWEDDWFIEDSRLNFYGINDQKFLDFLSYVIHPDNLSNYELVSELVIKFNNKLIRDGFEIKEISKKISGFPLFEGTKIIFGGEKINFYTYDYEGEKEYPYLYLEFNNWDDYHWKTTFVANLHINKLEVVDLGRIKVLDKNITNPNGHTELPSSFIHLSQNYCSIFSTDDGFKKLDMEKIRIYKKTILKSLNEVSFNKNIFNDFKDIPGFSESLLRESEVFARIQNMKKTLLNFGIKKENGDILFDFENSDLPYRINVLIGKNGCGKTTLLSDISKEIIEYNPNNTKLTSRPSFSKVIQISYSVFDIFKRPSGDNLLKFKYIYCGLRDEKDEISMLGLQKRLNESLAIIKQKSKELIFTYLLNDLLDKKNIEFLEIENIYLNCSSGEKILITILSQIISNIEENSLLLFDEPETHLHPNMIFKLVNVLYRLLDDNNAYLIIATHSPIILQQIPSNYVRVLDFYGNKNLNLECFGENFSEITKEVFGSYETSEILYRDIFKQLSKKYTEDGILELFNNNLNLNARIYLKSLFNNK